MSEIMPKAEALATLETAAAVLAELTPELARAAQALAHHLLAEEGHNPTSREAAPYRCANAAAWMVRSAAHHLTERLAQDGPRPEPKPAAKAQPEAETLAPVDQEVETLAPVDQEVETLAPVDQEAPNA